MDTYKITEITGDFDANFGKRRVVFKVEGNPNTISGFFQQAPVVGDTLSGEIVQKDKYWNFRESKGTFQKAGTNGYQPAPDALRVERKVDAVLTEIQMVRTTLNDIKGVIGGAIQATSPVLEEPPF